MSTHFKGALLKRTLLTMIKAMRKCRDDWQSIIQLEWACSALGKRAGTSDLWLDQWGAEGWVVSPATPGGGILKIQERLKLGCDLEGWVRREIMTYNELEANTARHLLPPFYQPSSSAWLIPGQPECVLPQGRVKTDVWSTAPWIIFSGWTVQYQHNTWSQ